MRRTAPPVLVVALGLALVSCAAPDGGSRGGGAAAAEDAAPKATAAANTTTKGTGRASCPVTRPQQPPFVPPKPYRATPPPLYGGFWYGSDELWTMLNADGTWEMPRNEHGLFDKSFWWRAGFDLREQTPKLTLTARRLDVPGPQIAASSGQATNGWRDDDDIGAFMLTGIELPAVGCWEITGHYRARKLSFVAWVTRAT